MISIKDKIEHNLFDYENVRSTFYWKNLAQKLGGLPNGKGLNIAHEAIDRHAESHLKNIVALQFIHKNRSFTDFTYSDLQHSGTSIDR